MKKVVKKFCHRGLMVASGGPLVYAIVMLVLQLCGVDTLSDGITIFKAILTTSVLAFIVAGTSVVWQEERLGAGLAAAIHGSALYVCYLGMYLVNSWLPRSLMGILGFSVIFVGTYLVIWLIVYICEKHRAKNLNNSLKGIK